MRIWELTSGILTHLSEEESSLMDRYQEETEPNLSDREKIVAQDLVHKNVLMKEEILGKEIFKAMPINDVWRD